MNIKANITKHPSKVHTVQATGATGEPVAFCNVENILVVNGFSMKSQATPLEKQFVGDALTAETTKAARLEGVSKIWVVVPDDYPGTDARTIRVVEETLPQELTSQRIGCYSPVPPVTYFN